MIKVTKNDLKKMFWRLQLLQVSWNYERMQGIGFLYIMKPVLKRLYASADREGRTKAIKRHLEFFNTQPTLAAPIIGITAAMEERGGNEAGQAITSLKTGMMGPLAGLGDSLIWLTWMPICMSIGVSFAAQGNPLGLILALLMFNVVNIPLKYYGISFGYEKGVSFLEDIKATGIIQRFTVIATILGLVLVGGLIPQMVNINVPISFQINDVKVVVQDILDGIMPKLLPLLVTLICYFSLKRRKNTLTILFTIIIVSILGNWIGLLG